MPFQPLVASATVQSKVVILLLLSHWFFVSSIVCKRFVFSPFMHHLVSFLFCSHRAEEER